MAVPMPGAFRPVPILQTGPVTERLRVREIDDDEGRRLVRIVRRGSGSVVIWRRPQMVLLSAQGMDAAAIAKVAFTSEDRVRDGLPTPTEQMVAYSRSDSNATTRRATAAHEGTQDRGALAHRPAPWPELIKMRSFSQASRVPARLIR
jgi:hypothetical protein